MGAARLMIATPDCHLVEQGDNESYLRFSAVAVQPPSLKHSLGAAADNGLSSQHTLPSLSHY